MSLCVTWLEATVLGFWCGCEDDLVSFTIIWLFNYLVLADENQESNYFNGLSLLCKDYKEEDGSRCAPQNYGKTKLKLPNIEKGDQVSQFLCDIDETPFTWNIRNCR